MTEQFDEPRPWFTARVSDWIRLHCLRQVGLELVTWDEIQRNFHNRRCARFQQERDRRTLMGYVRYEQLGARKGLTKNVPDAIKTLVDLYVETKNREFLTDIANYAELEWQYPSFEGTFFEGTERL